MKKIALILCLLALVGCEERKLTKTETVHVEIVDINPPKYFKVKLRNIETGVSEWVSVSKRCSNYRQNRIGDKIAVTVNHYETSKRAWYEFQNLKSQLCEHRT